MSDAPSGPDWFKAADGKWYPPSPGQHLESSLNGLAVASMVLGIVWIYWVGSVLAVIFGHIALSQVRKNPKQKGKGFAIAGIALGWTGVGILILIVVLASISY